MTNSHLKILNNLRNNGNEFLEKIKGSSFYEKQEEFDGLKKIFKPFFDENEKFIFGHSKNSMKKDFVLSLYPLFLYIKEQIKLQSNCKFITSTNSEIYNFILDFLEIPFSILSKDDLELYFKSKFRMKGKTPDSELPF